MSGDYSRTRFDPRKHFTGVLMQQGRVQLDSDWNEMVLQFDRRFRAERSDTLLRHIVPRRTPDAFRVRLGDGKLSLGAGRMYVDGLMPENHGDPSVPAIFDPVLHEPRSPGPIDYASGQPYFPAAVVPALPAGPFLVYLDTWQREVTFIEDPGLVEPALGVDTTTRSQTAWRVRILPGVATPPTPAEFDPLVVPQRDDYDPASHIPPAYWAALTRAPAGRLSTGTVDTQDPGDNPCIIPPSGGYRGLENQLYRVEIHRSGPAGVARFKWSRDNASIAAQVLGVAGPAAITVSSVGRDPVLRFSAGDWVELLDDLLEPDGLRPEAGVLRRVLRVDDEARLLEFDPDPASDLTQQFPADTLTSRHTRVRRWDQPAADLAVPKDGAPVLLEHGVTVSFTTADPADPAPFRAGDHWTFAARTEGSVEALDRTPPHGDHHHHAPLAWVDPTHKSVVDLRTLWPQQLPAGAGECTHHLRAESHNHPEGFTIQQALDDLRPRGGGSICLGPGVFYITDDALRIDHLRNVSIRGQGARTVLIRQFTLPPAPANPDDDEPPPDDHERPAYDADVSARALLRISESANISISDLVLVSSPAPNGRTAGLAIQTVADLRLERCFLLHVGASAYADDSPAISLRGAVVRPVITDNVIVANLGLGLDRGQDLLLVDARIDDNTLSTRNAATQLSGYLMHGGRTSFSRNHISSADRGLLVEGLVHPGGRVDITDNTIDSVGAAIAVGTTRTLVRGNTLRGGFLRDPADPAPTTDPRGGVGVVVTALRGADLCHIVGNSVVGFDWGVRVLTRTRDLRICDNRLQDIASIAIANDFNPEVWGSESVTVAGNVIQRVGGPAVTLRQGCFGIALFGCRHLSIADNTLEQVGDLAPELPAPSPTPFLVHAIFVEATQHCDIRNNHIRDTGPVRSFPDNGNPLIAAIFVHNPLGGVQVTGNRVCYSDRSRLEVPRAALHIIRPGRSGTGFVEPLFPGGFKGNSLAFSDHAIILPDGTRPFQILGNHFESIRTNHPNGINDGVLINADALNLTFTGNFVQQTLASGNDIGQFLLATGNNGAVPFNINIPPPDGACSVTGNSFVAEYFVAPNSSPNVLLNTLLVTAIGNHLSVGDIFCSHRTTFTVGTRRIDFNVGPQLTNPNRGGVNPAGIL